ncbi:MAG: ABC-2 family transporter protein [Nannocystaceae bacterium]
MLSFRASRSLQIAAAQLRVSVLAALEYRAGFWSDGVVSVLWGLVGVAPLLVALEHRADVAGWGAWELMVLTGCFMIVSGIFSALLDPALIKSMEHIRRGTLDFLLLRPADPLVLCLTAEFMPWGLLESVVGGALVIVSLVALGVVPGVGDLAAALVVFLAGVTALYALGILALAVSFKALRLHNITVLFESLLDFARWPSGVFSGPLKALFTFIIPFAVMTTQPAQGLLGRLDAAGVATAVATSAGLLILARVAWVRALRSYTSASS